MSGDPTVDQSAIDLAGLAALAREVVAKADPGCVVWLSGDLGSGKTAFVKEAARAAGARDASSPTYALVHEYHSPNGAIYHADCYRLEDPAEAVDLDFPELTRSGVLVFVEWPEKAGDSAPKPDIHLHFSHIGDPHRRRVERLL